MSGQPEHYTGKTRGIALSTVPEAHQHDTKKLKSTSHDTNEKCTINSKWLPVRDAFSVRNKANGFTLAEVLITLGIIGIVAAMTLPTLIQKQQEKININRLKKIYSVLQQTYIGLYYEYGSPSNWDILDDSEKFRDLFGTKIHFTKKCDSNKEGCWYNAYTKRIDGTPSENFVTSSVGNYAFAKTDDGTLFAFSVSDTGCEDFNKKDLLCGSINVDLNGYQKPNQWGHDVFQFLLMNDRLVPRGKPDAEGAVSFKQYCLKIGHSCAAWVLINENMDYLHCKDLNWNGKTKCK